MCYSSLAYGFQYKWKGPDIKINESNIKRLSKLFTKTELTCGQSISLMDLVTNGSNGSNFAIYNNYVLILPVRKFNCLLDSLSCLTCGLISTYSHKDFKRIKLLEKVLREQDLVRCPGYMEHLINL